MRSKPVELNTSTAIYVTEIKENDVLCGRGSGPNENEGNIRFRSFIVEREIEYRSTNNRGVKSNIAGDIIKKVLDGGGRFLQKINRDETKRLGLQNNTYIVASDDTIMEKIKQALRQNRDKSHNTNKTTSSTAAQQQWMTTTNSPDDTKSSQEIKKEIPNNDTSSSFDELQVTTPTTTNQMDEGISFSGFRSSNGNSAWRSMRGSMMTAASFNVTGSMLRDSTGSIDSRLILSENEPSSSRTMMMDPPTKGISFNSELWGTNKTCSDAAAIRSSSNSDAGTTTLRQSTMTDNMNMSMMRASLQTTDQSSFDNDEMDESINSRIFSLKKDESDNPLSHGTRGSLFSRRSSGASNKKLFPLNELEFPLERDSNITNASLISNISQLYYDNNNNKSGERTGPDTLTRELSKMSFITIDKAFDDSLSI